LDEPSYAICNKVLGTGYYLFIKRREAQRDG